MPARCALGDWLDVYKRQGKPLPRVNGYPPPLGGEQALLAFLEHTLMPEIARRYPVDPRRQILVGHSFGGMYALNVLYTRPDLFTQIVSISPSLWWQDHYLLERESAFVRQAQAGKHDLRRSRLLLMAGGAESPQTVHEARSLARRLDQSLAPQGLATVYVELPEETHMSVPVAAEMCIRDRVVKTVMERRRTIFTQT